MKLKIGISPCPNDTYIFEAIYNHKVVSEDIEFEFVFEDVQTLNEMALKHELDIVKISYAHYFSVMEPYAMLRSGGAMGNGVGPLLISKKIIPAEEVKNCVIAIPGINTTANFLLTFAFPDIKQRIPCSFDKIESAVLHHEVDAGVIIHENRFTYAEKGLHKIMDLGTYWEQKTSLPIPLGGIAISRKLSHSLQLQVNNLIRQSIEIADKHKEILNDFIKGHAQEMSEDVMKKHIALYVNDFSKDIGTDGIYAVEKMKEVLNIDSNTKMFI